MNTELIKVYKSFLPFSTDDIYLKDNQKQIKAVCSNSGIADFLACCVNSFSNVTTENLNRGELYKDFIKAAYFLSIAIKQSNIRVNSVSTILLEKVFNLFLDKLNKILDLDKIKIDTNVNSIDTTIGSIGNTYDMNSESIANDVVPETSMSDMQSESIANDAVSETSMNDIQSESVEDYVVSETKQIDNVEEQDDIVNGEKQTLTTLSI